MFLVFRLVILLILGQDLSSLFSLMTVDLFYLQLAIPPSHTNDDPPLIHFFNIACGQRYLQFCCHMICEVFSPMLWRPSCLCCRLPPFKGEELTPQPLQAFSFIFSENMFSMSLHNLFWRVKKGCLWPYYLPHSFVPVKRIDTVQHFEN